MKEKRAVVDNQEFSTRERYFYIVENYFARDEHIIFKLLLALVPIFTIGLGILWAAVANTGNPKEDDWLLQDAQKYIWWSFQMIVTLGFDESIGSEVGVSFFLFAFLYIP